MTEPVDPGVDDTSLKALLDFRPSAEAPDIAEQAVSAGAKTLWLQLGIASTDARAIAVAGGLTYLEDVCIGATTLRLGNRAAQSLPPAQP